MTHATFATHLPATTPAVLFARAYLARYTGSTRNLYDRHLGRWLTWCTTHGIEPLAATRLDREAYIQDLVAAGAPASTVRSALSPVRMMYKLACSDGIIARDPGAMVWLPKLHRDPGARPWLDRHELARWINTARGMTPRHWALAVLLGVMALRSSEAASLRIEDAAATRDGYRVLRFTGKGNKPATMPLTIPIIRAIDAATEGRTTGPIITNRTGTGPTNRNGIANMVTTITKHAGIEQHLHPHAIRASAITAALDAGMSLRDAQNLARHADPSTTVLYDRNAYSLDRHPVHALSAWLAS